MNVSLSQKAVKVHRLFPFRSSSEPYEFVSLEWLQKWLDESTPTKPIDNHACLCSHDKLHPDKISIMKRISEYAADIFYSRYGGGPRLTGNFRCLLNKKQKEAQAGVTQWIEHRLVNQRVTGSIPSLGTCLGCGPGPQWGPRESQLHIDVSPFLSPSLPLSLKISLTIF